MALAEVRGGGRLRDEPKECLRERLIRRRVSSEQIIETEQINGREMGR